MKHKLAIGIALTVVVLAVGSTVAWAATHGSFSGHMSSGQMHQADNGHMGQMDKADMRAMMARMHRGLDTATLDKLVGQCTKAMKDMSAVHGSSGTGDMDDMMGGSSHGGMMGSSSGGMMGTSK